MSSRRILVNNMC